MASDILGNGANAGLEETAGDSPGKMSVVEPATATTPQTIVLPKMPEPGLSPRYNMEEIKAKCEANKLRLKTVAAEAGMTYEEIMANIFTESHEDPVTKRKQHDIMDSFESTVRRHLGEKYDESDAWKPKTLELFSKLFLREKVWWI